MNPIHCHIPIKIRIAGELTDEEAVRLGTALDRLIRSRLDRSLALLDPARRGAAAPRREPAQGPLAPAAGASQPNDQLDTPAAILRP